MNRLVADIAAASEVAFLMEKASEFIAVHGFRVEHEALTEVLKRAGASENAAGRICLPKGLQEEALSSVPRAFLVAGADPRFDVQFPHPRGLFYAQGPIGQTKYLDALTGELRPCTMDDQIDFVKVQQACEHISFWGNFTAQVENHPVRTLDLHTALNCMKHCSKPGTWMIYDEHSIAYGIEMAEAIAGGADAHARRPWFALEAAAASPMALHHMDAEMILQSARKRIPLICASLPTAGASAPITPEGIAFLSIVEGIFLVMAAQLVQPGTPCMVGSLHLTMDMRTTQTISTTAEMIRSMMLSIQVLERGYHLPVRTMGVGANAHTVDGQTLAEDAIASHLTAIAGASLLDGLGTYDNWMAASPLQMIIDNDLVAMAQNICSGVTVDLDRIGYDAIVEQIALANSAFIDTDHTMEYFREILYPKTFLRDSYAAWERGGKADMLELAREEYKRIIAEHKPVPHSPELLKELDSIVARADRSAAE